MLRLEAKICSLKSRCCGLVWTLWCWIYWPKGFGLKLLFCTEHWMKFRGGCCVSKLSTSEGISKVRPTAYMHCLYYVKFNPTGGNWDIHSARSCTLCFSGAKVNCDILYVLCARIDEYCWYLLKTLDHKTCKSYPFRRWLGQESTHVPDQLFSVLSSKLLSCQ